MPAPRLRDAQVVAALRHRMGHADSTTLSNLAWFAARRGERVVALEVARAAAAMPDAPRAAWRALERLAAGHSDGMLLASAGHDAPARSGAGNPLAAAVAAHRQLEFAIAEACYRTALQHSAMAPAAWNGLGVLHEQRRERAAADAAWEHAAVAGNIAAMHNRALAMLRRGFPHRARTMLTPLVELRDAPRSLRFLGAYAALSDLDPDAALVLITSVVADDPDSARAHFTLGLICERLGRHPDALSAIRRALMLSPWYFPEVWLVEPGAELPAVELAVDHGEPGTGVHTNDVLLSLGRSLLQTANLGEALAVFDQVLVHDPSQAVALFHRGVVLAKLRRYDEALEDWESVGRADSASELADASRRHAQSARQLASLFAVQ